MDAYIFEAALICEECARRVREELLNGGAEDTGDSDDYPQGPYTEGGGEADSPQHCDVCGVFLENPLTGDGTRYVYEMIAEGLAAGRGDREVMKEWVDFYDLSLGEAFDVLRLRK